MSDQAEGGAKPKFDPVKLEQLNVARDYPMDEDEFTKLYEHNCYCEMAHINKKGFPIVTPMFYVIIDGILHMSSIKNTGIKFTIWSRTRKSRSVFTTTGLTFAIRKQS